ncbi:hypothetical protein P3W45_001470 [Vairimorpha bombi]|jgi:ubiquitin carboxyl-terminal hydrolase 7
MKHYWKTSNAAEKESKTLSTFECDGNEWETVIYMYKSNPYFYLLYKGSSYFDINVRYDIIINQREVKGIYQFSQFARDFGFILDKQDEYEIELSLEVLSGSYDSKSMTGYNGLRNLGATCYINSFMQGLFHINKFKNDIFSCEPKNKILFLQKLFYKMENEDKPIDSTEFVVNNVWDNNLHLHQDIHEFSKIFFDMVEKESKRKEIVESLIQGHVVNFINGECGCSREIKESFQDIQVEIRDFFNNKLASNLQDSLKLYTKVESLDGNNKYMCEKHGLVNAKKGVLFSDLPPMLFVLLKRFNMDFETGESRKVSDFFEFPEVLDMKEFCVKDFSKSAKYNLYSVIVHKGGHEEGHFYSYIFLNNEWYKFNDNIVTKVSKEEAMYMNYGGKHPYYRRKTDYSAYYLIYLNTDRISDLLYCEVNVPESVVQELVKESKKQEIRCLTYKDIKNYRGIGFYNLNSFDYPLTTHSEFSLLETDTIKMLRNKVGSFLCTKQNLYIFEIKPNHKLKYIEDGAVSVESDYFVYKKYDQVDFTKMNLIFIKIFRDEVWCRDTYPENLYLAFVAVLEDDLTKIRKYLQDSVNISDFVIFKEDVQKKKVILFDKEDGQDDYDVNKRHKDDSYKYIENGDILVIVEKSHKELFKNFYNEFSQRICINVLYEEGNSVTLFLPKDTHGKNLEKILQSSFSNTEITINEDNNLKINSISDISMDKNTVSIELNDNKMIYVGQCLNIIDYNAIKHIHSFVIPHNMKGSDLIKTVLVSNFICLSGIQKEKVNELRIVDTVKGSLYLKAYSINEEFTSEGMNIIQKFPSKNYIKIAYFTGTYSILGYPFFLFITNETVLSFREEYRITSRLVKFDGNGYIDLEDEDNISELGSECFLLIERHI